MVIIQASHVGCDPQTNILLHNYDGQPCVIIDKQLLPGARQDGLNLHLAKLIASDGESTANPILNSSLQE